MNTPSDQAYWRKYVADRDSQAFEKVVSVYYGLVYSVCRRSMDTHLESVEDAVQETFCKLAEKADTIHTNLASWLHSCALNTAREIVRKDLSRRDRETTWAKDKEQAARAASHDTTSGLDEAIASLKESDRVLVVEHFLVGRSQTELARELGITPSAVNKRLVKVLGRLRQRLALLGVTATVSSLTSSLAASQAQATAISKIAAQAQKSAAEILNQTANSTTVWSQWTGGLWTGGLSSTGKLSLKTWGLAGGAFAIFCSAVWYQPLLRTLLPMPTVAAQNQAVISGGQAGDSFGQSLAIRDTHLLVGAPSDRSAGLGAGAVYAFHKEGDEWTQVEKILSPSGEGSVFGGTLTICKNTVAIGGTSKPVGAEFQRNVSEVQLYKFSAGRWDHEQTLQADEGQADSYYGSALAIHGNQLLVGAAYDDTQADNAGAVYPYRRTEFGWIPYEKLLAPTRQPRSGFGWSVALDNGYAAVAAPGDNEHGQLAGAVYVYHRVDGQWKLQQKLTVPDGRSGHRFGEAVAMDGETLAIGASDRAAKPKGTGSVYLFEKQHDRWRHTQTLAPAKTAAGAEFGGTLAIDEGVLVVGASRASSAVAGHSGAAYVYSQRWGKWTLSKILAPTASEVFSSFGSAVGISQGEISVGCAGESDTRLSGDSAEQMLHALKSGQAPSAIPQIRKSPGRVFAFSVE